MCILAFVILIEITYKTEVPCKHQFSSYGSPFSSHVFHFQRVFSNSFYDGNIAFVNEMDLNFYRA